MTTLINCQQVTKYFAAKCALNQVSFQCESGRPIALIGPNGAGKTTLFSILCGFIPASSGQIDILGHPAGDNALFDKLSALPQDAQMDPDITISRQLAFYAELKGMNIKAAQHESDRVLEMMGLDEVKQALPKMLSHGMKKRAAIAQALIGKPQLILLDEPTAGLDPANAKVIRELISQLACQTTFLISSHNLQELERLCDQVLYLDKGINKDMTTAVEPVSSEYEYLSIRLIQYAEGPFIDLVKSLHGVEQVHSPHKNEFKIRFRSTEQQDLDLLLLQKIKANGWSYQQLTVGETLEDRLFD